MQARLALEAARAIQRFQLGAISARGAARLQRGRAHTLGTAGKVARYRGQLAEAEAFQREALQLWEAADDEGGAAAALHELGVLQLRRADWAAARALLTQALGMKRRTKHAAGGAHDVAATLHQLAVPHPLAPMLHPLAPVTHRLAPVLHPLEPEIHPDPDLNLSLSPTPTPTPYPYPYPYP